MRYLAVFAILAACGSSKGSDSQAPEPVPEPVQEESGELLCEEGSLCWFLTEDEVLDLVRQPDEKSGIGDTRWTWQETIATAEVCDPARFVGGGDTGIECYLVFVDGLVSIMTKVKFVLKE